MNAAIASAVLPQHGNLHDDEHDAYMERLSARFLVNIKQGTEPLFTTDVDNLFDVYLSHFEPGRERQYHNCSACRQFINRFGSLATISTEGLVHPAIWDESDAPPLYRASVMAMAQAVRRAKVTGVFLSKDEVWGTPVTGIWQHFAVMPPAAIRHQHAVLTAGQAIAEKREDFGNVSRALGEFPPKVVEQALTLLKSDALYRSEKVLGPAQFLHDLHTARANAKGHDACANMVWRAIAAAPAGFCHPRSSMIGTLLEDLVARLDFDEVSRRFKAKMHPLLYQRPQAAPTAGNIVAGEKLIAQMGLEPSLRRRFARADELRAFWTAPAKAEDAPTTGGVFAHLKPKDHSAAAREFNATNSTPITMEKFCRTVLLQAENLEILVPNGSAAFMVFTTAVDPEAPPLLQWDHPDRRNPFASYFWSGGAPASQYGLSAGRYYPVVSIVSRPSMWDEPESYAHMGKDAAFIIEGARETRLNGGLALFPETLRSELHGVRSTIEAYSRSRNLENAEGATACGLVIGDVRSSVTVRVRQGGVLMVYHIERWD